MTIKDKTVLVTGANRGIGQALAAEALAGGAKRVYACTRQPLPLPGPVDTDMTRGSDVPRRPQNRSRWPPSTRSITGRRKSSPIPPQRP